MAIKLSAAEKDEIRRLTQKVNRRIKAFMKTYEKSGHNVIPKEVTGGLNIQARQQFMTDKYAISRSVKFDSREDYKRHLNMLRKFDPGRADSVPTVRRYNTVSRMKLRQAFETAGIEMSPEMSHKINNMSAAEIRTYWSDYQNLSRRKGLQYASGEDLMETLEQYTIKDKRNVMKRSLKKG